MHEYNKKIKEDNEYYDKVYKEAFTILQEDNQIEIKQAIHAWSQIMKAKNFKHLELWLKMIQERHDNGNLVAVTLETWSQFGKMVNRAKESDLSKIKVNSGLWNDIIVDFVKT